MMAHRFLAILVMGSAFIAAMDHNPPLLYFYQPNPSFVEIPVPAAATHSYTVPGTRQPLPLYSMLTHEVPHYMIWAGITSVSAGLSLYSTQVIGDILQYVCCYPSDRYSFSLMAALACSATVQGACLGCATLSTSKILHGLSSRVNTKKALQVSGQLIAGTLLFSLSSHLNAGDHSIAARMISRGGQLGALGLAARGLKKLYKSIK